jgi:hypothetical protein
LFKGPKSSFAKQESKMEGMVANNTRICKGANLGKHGVSLK